jgi:hypothetical protein
MFSVCLSPGLNCIATHLVFTTSFFVILLSKAFQLGLRIVESVFRMRDGLHNQLSPALWAGTEFGIRERSFPGKLNIESKDGAFGTLILLGGNGETVYHPRKEECYSLLSCGSCSRCDD